MILLILQYYPYQYRQIESFVEKLGDVLVVAEITEEEETSKKKDRRDSGYRIVNHRDPSIPLSEQKYSIHDLIQIGFKFEYLIYTGVPRIGISRIASLTKRGYGVLIGHSIISSRYDTSLVLPEANNLVGLLPEAWKGFTCVNQEFIAHPQGRFSFVPSAAIAAEAIRVPPKVQVENKLGAIFGCLSAFKTYHKVLKKIIAAHGIEKVKVKFHPLTDMNDPAVIGMVEDPDFEIVPTQSDKYDFTDSCKWLIGGCSSLLIEAVLRNEHFQSGQHISKFKERRGINLRMIENDVDPEWKDEPPHVWMVRHLNTELILEKMVEIVESYSMVNGLLHSDKYPIQSAQDHIRETSGDEEE